MTLRARLALIMCATVAAAVVAVSVLGYVMTRHRLLDDVDRQLDQRARFAVSSAPVAQARRHDDGFRLPEVARRFRERGRAPVDPFADPDTAFQVIDASGSVLARPGGNPVDLPVDDIDREIARAEPGTASHRNVRLDGAEERMVTLAAGDGVAVQVAGSLEATEETLHRLVILFVVVGSGVVAVTVVSGTVVISRSLQPIRRLTDAAEHVARTKELTAEIEQSGTADDEVGRLSAAFAEMLRALSAAREQQRQLVVDASHELRTPLTALRTNIELLSVAAERDRLDDPEVRELMADARRELEELSALVSEIVELAADVSNAEQGAMEPVELVELVEDVAQRASRRYGRRIEVRTTGAPVTVMAWPRLLERAVSNLLDNATKWDRTDVAIEVEVRGGRVTVRDHGPGLGGADPNRLFHRFYRGPGTQATPGSGLGLAIVEQAVARHGGRAFAANADGGGAAVGFELPVATS